MWGFWRLRKVDAVESDVSGGSIRGPVIGWNQGGGEGSRRVEGLLVHFLPRSRDAASWMFSVPFGNLKLVDYVDSDIEGYRWNLIVCIKEKPRKARIIFSYA
jgi:hypothetical protein